ncbi:protein-tyrosine-phosphatase, partial [Coemansia sp. RSA 2611]
MNAADIIDPLIPPYRFERVQDRLYRGGYPKPRNFRFLRRQRLRTLVSLVPADRDTNLGDFCRAEHIERICIGVESPSENVTLTEQVVSRCLELMTDPARAPLYLHCLDGSNVTGVVVMCLRKLQLWRVASLQNEYLRFEQDGEIIPEESEFVELYKGKTLELRNPVAPWLWPGRACTDARLPFAGGVHPVVPLARILPPEPPDICRADPLASLSRSATDPSLSEASLRPRPDAEPGSGTEPQPEPARELLPPEAGALAGLHVSRSTSVLAEPAHAERQPSSRRSRPQSEIHDVLDPVLAVLAGDEPAEHDALSVASSRRDPSLEQPSMQPDAATSQAAEPLLQLRRTPDRSSAAGSVGPRAAPSEIRELTLSMRVRALAIEGLG